nr:6-carboxytetrahydropterin synthase [Candidatus Sigynarchaeota archaeon]
MTVSIIVDGMACKFSAAHFLAGHPKCGRLHGHNYHASVKITGSIDKNGMVLDFVDAKAAIQSELDELDHRLLLPAISNRMIITEAGENTTIAFDKKHYSVPSSDVLLLPLPAITAEMLAKYLHSKIKVRFPGFKIVVRVAETCSASAEYGENGNGGTG